MGIEMPPQDLYKLNNDLFTSYCGEDLFTKNIELE